MNPILRRTMLIALTESLRREPVEVAIAILGVNERVYFSLEAIVESGLLLRISAISTAPKGADEGWKASLGEIFAEAVTLVSDIMRRAGIAFRTDEGDIRKLVPRRGKYISSIAFGEAVWLQAASASAEHGMREANQEEVLLHADDFTVFARAVQSELDEIASLIKDDTTQH